MEPMNDRYYALQDAEAQRAADDHESHDAPNYYYRDCPLCHPRPDVNEHPFREVAPAAAFRYYLVHGVYGADNVDCASLVLAGNKRDAVLAMQQHWTSFALDNVRRVDRSDFHPATYVIGA